MVVDPSLEEEATATGLMTVILNAFGDLCAVQKTSGIGLPATEVQSACNPASSSASFLVCSLLCSPWRSDSLAVTFNPITLVKS